MHTQTHCTHNIKSTIKLVDSESTYQPYNNYYPSRVMSIMDVTLTLVNSNRFRQTFLLSSIEGWQLRKTLP